MFDSIYSLVVIIRIYIYIYIYDFKERENMFGIISKSVHYDFGYLIDMGVELLETQMNNNKKSISIINVTSNCRKVFSLVFQ
jgi:hypothetical protein